MRARSFLVLLVVAVAAALSGVVGASAGPGDPSVGGFIIKCLYSHTLSDDPIVYPGQPGASHSHDFFGNESTNANSTYDSMVEASSNCGLDTDTAGYWVPTPSLNGTPFHAAGRFGDMRIYYRAAGAQDVETIPAGLETIGGSKDALYPPPTSILSWYCGAGVGGSTPIRNHPYDCSPYAQQYSFVDGVVAIVAMPRCWDGNGVLPSNVRYPEPGAGVTCGAGFNHMLPLVTERVHFGIMDPCAGLQPCGPDDPDTNVRLSFSSGPYYTLHADFWNTWHQDVLDTLVDDCINAHVACSFLASHYKVSVALDGSGIGTVTSDPAGIDCGSTCVATFDTAAHVTLTASPAEGSSFDGWGGDCTGTDPCTLPMEHARNVTASFDSLADPMSTLTVTRAGAGDGTVTSDPSGIDCGDTCTARYPASSSVTLTATPDAGSLFAGWKGPCSGKGKCTVTMDQDRTATALFTPKVYRPDAAIRSAHSGFVGVGSTGTTGTNETVTAKARPGGRMVFTIALRNGGNVPDAVRVLGGGRHGPFGVRYLDWLEGASDITARVIHGTFRTGSMSLGQTHMFRLVVDVARGARAGTSWTFHITARSVTAPSALDVVGAHVVALR